jgi:hypothetical protein
MAIKGSREEFLTEDEFASIESKKLSISGTVYLISLRIIVMMHPRHDPYA